MYDVGICNANSDQNLVVPLPHGTRLWRCVTTGISKGRGWGAFCHARRTLYLQEIGLSLWGNWCHPIASSERGVCGGGFWSVSAYIPLSKWSDSDSSLTQHLFLQPWDLVNNYFTTVVLFASRRSFHLFGGNGVMRPLFLLLLALSLPCSKGT